MAENNKYIAGNDYEHLDWRDKRNFKKFSELIKDQQKTDEFFGTFIKSFVLGKSVYGDSPLRRRYFWKLPRRTNDYTKNYNNIIKWLSEYAGIKANNFSMENILHNELQTREMEHFKFACTTQRSALESVEYLNDIRKTKNLTKYDLYQQYLNSLVIHEKRKKPWFWQKEARAQYNAEKEALKDFENYLTSIGINKKFLKHAKKNYRLDDSRTFNTSLRTNAHDRVEQFKQAYKNMEILNEEVKKNHASRNSKRFALVQASVNYYLGCLKMHKAEANKPRNSYEQQAYEEEKRLIDNYKNTMLNKYNINEEYLNNEIERHTEERFSGNNNISPHCTLVPAVYSTYYTNTAEELNLMNTLITNLRSCPKGYGEDDLENDYEQESVVSDEDLEDEIEFSDVNIQMQDQLKKSFNEDISLSNRYKGDEDSIDNESEQEEIDDLAL